MVKQSRQEQLRKSQEARREARDKIRENLAKRNKSKKKAKTKKKKAESDISPPGKSPPADLSEKNVEFECTVRFADERDEALEYHRAEPLYELLAAELTGLASSAKVATSLVWPAFPSCVPAVHSVATCAAY